MTENVRVRLNVLGVDLNSTQINAILDQHNNSVEFERRWLASFFQLEKSELTRGLLSRYAEADARMKRISAGTFQEDIHTQLINTLASAKRCYAYGELFACIELCALHGEMLANYLCITSKEILFSDPLINQLTPNDQEEIRRHQMDIFFSDHLGQRLRLRWLTKGDIITPENNDHLLGVHDLRIQYFHRWSDNRASINEDALTALSEISHVSSYHLELLGSKPREFNNENLSRVKKYMGIISLK